MNLADPHVRVADMTGDGTADLVRIDGGGVTYWPYLGDGRWAAAVRMADPPELPPDVRPEELFLADVNGDGCADLVHIAGGAVRWWLNRSGNAFGPPAEVRNLPTGAMRRARIADMTGTGTAGVIWSSIGPGARGAAYFYLDLHGGANPHLLERIDNGVGLTTTVRYTTSAKRQRERGPRVVPGPRRCPSPSWWWRRSPKLMRPVAGPRSVGCATATVATTERCGSSPASPR